MIYTHKKIDLNDLTSQAFDNFELLLDSFDLDYKRVNQNKICLACPIHCGDNETGVSILTNRKTWACWTHNCHEQYGKNLFGFVQGVLSTKNQTQASFKDALKYVSTLYKVKHQKINVSKAPNENLNFANIVKLFNNDKCQNQVLVEQLNLQCPSEYFIKRGFSSQTLLHFEVGECYNIKYRAMIPIHDEYNSLVGYIGRSTKSYVLPKFLFSTGLIKTDHLYNYYNALPKIKEKNTVILVEGQGDVWKLFEAGVLNSVGCFGKDLSVKQIELLLKSGATNLIVMLDDDEAGREAKFKIQRQLHKLFKIHFPQLIKKDIGQLTVEQLYSQIIPQIKGYF